MRVTLERHTVAPEDYSPDLAESQCPAQNDKRFAQNDSASAPSLCHNTLEVNR